MELTYKGYKIVKQTVGRMGWNIVDPTGRCVKVGFSTLAAARDWITLRVETDALIGMVTGS